MRKGEERRQELLTVAERLFCTKGYEATSIQDILDVLHVSKGGFYHYFSSKEEVLDTLCRARAEAAAERANQQLSGVSDVMARLNLLLHAFMPLRREEFSFMNMLLPLLSTPEGRAMGLCYQEALRTMFLPALTREIDAGQASGTLFPAASETAGMVLHLVNACWLDVALGLIECARAGRLHDAVNLLSMLDSYRRGIEVLMGAPFGSVEMLRIDEWDEIATRLMRTLMMPM